MIMMVFVSGYLVINLGPGVIVMMLQMYLLWMDSLTAHFC